MKLLSTVLAEGMCFTLLLNYLYEISVLSCLTFLLPLF